MTFFCYLIWKCVCIVMRYSRNDIGDEFPFGAVVNCIPVVRVVSHSSHMSNSSGNTYGVVLNGVLPEHEAIGFVIVHCTFRGFCTENIIN